MRKIIVILLLALCWFGCKKPILEGTVECGIAMNDSSNVHPKNAQLLNLLEKYIQKGLPGISVYATDANGAWLGTNGKADVLNNVAYQSCHVQKVASLTKWFMGTLVFKLMEDSASSGLGYNDLDKPISTWIPEKKLKNITNADKITLRQCMNHSTGLFDLITDSDFYLEVLNDPTKKWTPDDLLTYVKNKNAEFEPGTKYNYSNTNTLMISLVIDYATGVPHHQLLLDKVIKPLGLQNTVYHHHQELPAFTAQGYFDLYQNRNPINVTNYVTGSGNGYTGIYSNVFDLHQFMKAVVIDRTFLSNKSMNYIEVVGQTDDEDVAYGLGIMKRFLKRGVDYGWGHTGRDLGYAADLFYFPNKNVSIAWCINYGADAESYLKPVILDFQKELIDLMQQ
jgi:D-alanyl-D-alanine carboxypeptidase